MTDAVLDRCSPASNFPLGVRDQRYIAAAREVFISNGTTMPGIRTETIAGWRRSLAAGAPSTGLAWSVQEDFDHDSALLRAVKPVVDALIEQFAGGDDLAMLAVDRNATIVGRWTASRTMLARMDSMGVLPGTPFDEARVGSTGLGSVLESGQLVVVDGAEHYNQSFDAVVAVGAPVINPGTGVVEGVIDLVSPSGAPISPMLPLVAAAAKEAGERLVSGYAREDRELLDAFMRFERRGARRPVVAVNSRLMLVNNTAGELLRSRSHPMLWGEVERALSEGRDYLVLGEDARAIWANIRVIDESASDRGVVLGLRSPEHHQQRSRPSQVARSITDDVTSVLAGRSLLWQQAVRVSVDALVSCRPVLLQGEAGTGKTALARAVARASCGRLETTGTQVVEVDFDQIVRSPGVEVGADVGAIITDVGAGAHDEVRSVIDRLSGHPRLRIVMTRTTESPSKAPYQAEDSASWHATLRTVDVPNLAFRHDDLELLIEHWSNSRGCRIDPAATRELKRRTWPGNVRELFDLLDDTSSTKAGLQIRVEDLPVRAPVSLRRDLSFLEAVERDAIARLLSAAEGRKMDVARELGVSRSTLYRKLAALGLEE